MPRWINILLQVVALLSTYANNLTAVVPPQYQARVNLGIVLFAAIVGIIAHSYNTDGTPQSRAYVKPEAK
jgi:hypothetical protein